MNARIKRLFALTPEAFWRWGQLALAGGLAFGLALVLLLAWKAPMGLLAVPVLLLAGVAVWYLFRHPLVNLCVVLASFVAVAGFNEGFQVEEIIYGLYYLGFLAYWFTTRLFFYQDTVLARGPDRALALLLFWVTGSFAFTFLFNGSFRSAISEWMAFSLLAFYFPVKEACARYRRGPHVVMGLLLWLGVFVAARNLLGYRTLLQSAEMAWQIVRGRVITNEILLLVPSLAVLVLLLHANRWSHRLTLTAGFLLYFASLIMTQSRAYWIDFIFGALVLFLLVDRRQKYRLATWSLSGIAGLVAILLLFFDDLFLLIASGLLDRLVSIGSAASADISLVNRFYEWQDVWTEIKKNPIIGYGLGVSYSTFDIISDNTITKTFSHNGFLMIWFKFGVLGLVALLYFWAQSIWDGLHAFWQQQTRHQWRLYGLIAAVCLIAMLPSANTSVPFQTNDTTFAFALVAGWAAGLRKRATQHATAS